MERLHALFYIRAPWGTYIKHDYSGILLMDCDVVTEQWIALIHDCPAVMDQAMVFESGGYGPSSILWDLLLLAARRATCGSAQR